MSEVLTGMGGLSETQCACAVQNEVVYCFSDSEYLPGEFVDMSPCKRRGW